MSQYCLLDMSSYKTRVKYPDIIYISEKLDKNESAFYSACWEREKKSVYQTAKMENSFPAANVTIILAFMQERRAMFKYVIPCVVSRWQRPGPSLCEAFSSVWVQAHAHVHISSC